MWPNHRWLAANRDPKAGEPGRVQKREVPGKDWKDHLQGVFLKSPPSLRCFSKGFTARGVENISGSFDMSQAESEAAIYKHIYERPIITANILHKKDPHQKNPENYISNQNHRFKETSTSWWFRPSWKIFVKLDDVPTLGIKNKKKNELPPPSPKLRPTKFPSNISVHRPGDSLRFPPRISTKDSLLIAPWLVTDWCQAVSQQKNPRSLMD